MNAHLAEAVKALSAYLDELGEESRAAEEAIEQIAGNRRTQELYELPLEAENRLHAAQDRRDRLEDRRMDVCDMIRELSGYPAI